VLQGFFSWGRKSPDPVEDRLLSAVAEGGARFDRLVLTNNRRVIASVADQGKTLRLHHSFRDAPPGILVALGKLFSARSAATRARAKAEVRTYVGSLPAAVTTPPRPRRYRPPATDVPHLTRLRVEFDRVNAAYFGDTLPSVPLRLSGRMRRRNGHFSADPLEIAIARQLCVRASHGEAERTLRHEMIHLWQHATGRKPGHGADFRRWARRLEIHPRATRTVDWIGCETE
jgi:hypothetical protein